MHRDERFDETFDFIQIAQLRRERRAERAELLRMVRDIPIGGEEENGRLGSRLLAAEDTEPLDALHVRQVLVQYDPVRRKAACLGKCRFEILLQWREGVTQTTPRDMPRPVPAALKGYRPTAAGTTLEEVRTLASRVGLSMRTVRREPGAPLVTPAVVHLGFEHFSAVLEEVDGRFRVRDPALGGEVWMTREALDEEMSGDALILASAPAPGWRELTPAEAATIVGHSCPPGLPDPDECPCPESEPGMPTYSLHPTQASVLLSDAPLGYSPPRGPSVSLQLRYNHREENQPQIFSFANVGAKWTLNWVSYLDEVPFTWFNEGGALAYAQPAHVAVHVPQGGVERFQYEGPGGVFERHYRSAAVLVRTSSNPLTFERRHTDGSTEVFGLSDGAVPGTRRVFLTALVDPHGQTLTFTWDAQRRLVALTDALGQVTTLQYEEVDPLKITSVTDPFGRLARLTYDADGHLASITDVITLTSRFVYGDQDFIAALQTPYGVTTFRTPLITGEHTRAIEAIDPLGAVERVEFHWTDGPVPASVPPSEVPPGFETASSELNTLMSLHWAKGRDTSNVQEAVASRWLLRSMDWMWDPGWTVSVPHSVQRPGEARTWYAYQGSTARPSRVARKLPDGSVYEVNATYNAQERDVDARPGRARDELHVCGEWHRSARGAEHDGGAHRSAGELQQLHGRPPPADDDGCGGAGDADDVQRVRPGADGHECEAGDDHLRVRSEWLSADGDGPHQRCHGDLHLRCLWARAVGDARRRRGGDPGVRRAEPPDADHLSRRHVRRDDVRQAGCGHAS
ncbi:MAG: cysteine peptidase family C39 domain-containing protein [Vicinamibacterales bacterium]